MRFDSIFFIYSANIKVKTNKSEINLYKLKLIIDKILYKF